MASIEPFNIAISQAQIDDLNRRLAAIRWPGELPGSGWDYGTSQEYLQRLLTYWRQGYDWRQTEQRLNSYPQFTTEIEGERLHFIHKKAEGEVAGTIVLMHGWPGTYMQMLRLLSLLTQGQMAWNVVIPSMPGFGFSEIPKEKGMDSRKAARRIAGLMEALGYDQYLIHGSDFGESVGRQLARQFPERVIALHINGFSLYGFDKPQNLSEAEQKYMKETQARQSEMGYGVIQSSKPQTVAYGLTDSPAGLAAWIVEKYQTWADNHGDIETRYPMDDMLDILSVYWFTGTIVSSMRLYYEYAHSWKPEDMARLETPAGFLATPHSFFSGPPREYVERYYNVVRWQEAERGGHFSEWEEPALVAEDLLAFAKERLAALAID